MVSEIVEAGHFARALGTEFRVVDNRIMDSERGKQAEHVLYVEDEGDDAFFMRLAFHAEGLETGLMTVRDGETAMRYLAGEGEYADRVRYAAPQLVLLDVRLPGVSGFDVLRWIRRRKEYERLPVYMFSSLPRDIDYDQTRRLGGTGFIEKPNSGMLFGGVVKELLGRGLRDGRGKAEC